MLSEIRTSQLLVSLNLRARVQLMHYYFLHRRRVSNLTSTFRKLKQEGKIYNRN